MNIIELHRIAGYPFTLPITFSIIALVTFFILYLMKERQGKVTPVWMTEGIRQLGYFSFFFGLFGQILGLIGAFDALSVAPASQQIIAAGLKVSFLYSVYGVAALLISQMLYFVISMRNSRKA